jgi:hypothetical protein
MKTTKNTHSESRPPAVFSDLSSSNGGGGGGGGVSVKQRVRMTIDHSMLVRYHRRGIVRFAHGDDGRP